MNLHESSSSFGDAIRATSDHLGLRNVFVEKDYWVTYLLYRLSKSAYADKVVFMEIPAKVVLRHIWGCFIWNEIGSLSRNSQIQGRI